MNCHQILSGACNAGDHCFAVGSVEGIPFTAYAAGCNIVILASTFERVQIIPGAIHNYVRISCVDCSTDTGKIAAAYENQVCVFEPTPLIQTNSSHQLDYRWVETGSWQTECSITALSWNLEGTRLLTGGAIIQLWHQSTPNIADEDNEGMTSSGVTFEIGEDAIGSINTNNEHHEEEREKGWECVWKCATATPVIHMAFSPDGTLFATAGYNDRLVKIWFENKQLLFPSRSTDHSYAQHSGHDPNFGFVYISHPRAVTQLSWRKTSKYMPKGSVSNMLVTSCRDNICRIWVETVLPDDGLVNMNQFDPTAAQNPKFRTHRHKHRFMQRLKHMKTCFHLRRNAKQNQSNGLNSSTPTIPTLPSTYSVHDFHSYGFHGTGVIPGLHFHLAASINAETDIPLVPSLITGDPDREPNFVLHWLNNKEMHFSLQAEKILSELTRKVVEKEEGFGFDNSNHDSSEHHDSEHDDKSMYATKKKSSRVAKSASQDESGGSDEHHPGSFPSSSHQTLSNATSINSLATDAGHSNVHQPDSLDVKIENLLRDWHHSPDLLFAIHPIDGSFLIWVVDWLDEYHPGSFRQAQVSFSTRIPAAFPLGDAITMSNNICLYHTSGCHLQLVFKDVVKTAAAARSPPNGLAGAGSSECGETVTTPLPSVVEEDDAETKEGEEEGTKEDEDVTTPEVKSGSTPSASDILSAPPCPTLSMVTKHSNGTLNLWQLTFADKTKFSQVLSIGHASRASGHRFRVNDITCHPVLPLLLTTSHHNLPEGTAVTPTSPNATHPLAPTGFCSELILWRVDAVGPLSKSGGVCELARINSPQMSAFSNVAWIPTLLPSTTLGNLSNSPSACFVASDGESLRVYQAVIDARTLLAEVSSSERRSRIMGSLVSLSTDISSEDGGKHHTLHDRIKIVSQQSTARPGCVIQLDAIADATHDWQNTQLLHVFQSQLICGQKDQATKNSLGLMENNLSAMVDLHGTAEFEEPFYLVVLERTTQGTTLHMWRLVIASQPDGNEMSESMMYVPDSQLVQDEDDQESSKQGADNDMGHPSFHTPHVSISTTKVCTQELPLPDGVDVIHAAPAGGHLSSASIYPACFAPYIIVTACSDSSVRFWKCHVEEQIVNKKRELDYEWKEWEMLRKNKSSLIEIPGQPLNISAAYSGRIACAYKYGKSFTRPSRKDPESRFVNLCVAIYECESTGGSEWVLEDTIYLKNIHLPRIQLDPHLDLSYLNDHNFFSKKQRIQNTFMKAISSEDLDSRSPMRNGDHNGIPENGNSLAKTTGLLAVPSFSTLQSLRKSIIENGNTCPLTQKHLVQLDWVSKEDGSHILTVGVGSKVMLFTPVSSDIAQANMKAMKESQTSNSRPILRKASSLAAPSFVDEIRWMKLRKIDLYTADGLPPLPMQISWVRDGIFIVGMDSEMHVYSQWKAEGFRAKDLVGHGYKLPYQESEDIPDTRNLRDEDLRNLAQDSSQRRLANVSSMPHLSRVSSINLTMLSAESKKKKANASSGTLVGHDQQQGNSNVDSYMPDYGLFEASRIACPVLPQYHPKQLMELLNSGKIRWVKAILAHLVRCISSTCSVQQGSVVCSLSDEENLTKPRGWSRSRTLSVSYGAGTTSPLEQRGSTTAIPEELTLDYAEITSIPPLPLWTLLAADKENTKTQNEENPHYNDLFDSEGGIEDEKLDDLLVDEDDGGMCLGDRRQSSNVETSNSLSHFGPRQGRLLSRLLTHTHLPGLSSLDQMHLLALADTVSTCNTDFAERFAIDAAKNAIAKENLTGVPDGQPASSDSLDDCGLRFLLAMKHYNYLLRCLPLAQRAQFQRQGITSNNVVWAFHSESEEELLSLIPSYAKGNPKWAILKEIGLGWWLRNHTLLKTCIEKVAKEAFQASQDPLDAAIFYLAMKKKSLVWGLFRSRRDERMTSFFSNDFTQDRWRKAALKNAFALLGKQRFEHAAAFFLLAGALRDAIEVCLNKLEDLQLAMVISRLYEGEMDSTPPNLKRLLYEEILGCDSNGENQDMSKVHPDPFLRSMALWILKDPTGSLNTLLLTNVGTMHSQYQDDDRNENASANPNVFNFYVYLRTHPLLIRHSLAASYQDKKKHTIVLAGFSYGTDARVTKSDRQLLVEDSITPLERQLYFTTAHAHFKAGCPALALEVLSKLPNKVIDPSDEDTSSLLNSPTKSKVQDYQIDTGILTWEDSQKTSNLNSSETLANGEGLFASNDLDWSQPVQSSLEDKLELDWGADVEDEDDDDGGLAFKTSTTAAEVDEPPNDTTGEGQLEEDSSAEPMDIMAQQLKFVACLKILMEELSTLATGYEVDGGQLRYQLYLWLEREVEALRQLCNYSPGDMDSVDQPYDIAEAVQDVTRDCNTPTLSSREKPTLHEILMAEKSDFEAKVQRAARRKKWLKANETLLRTLLSYCSLHGASGGGLASVRMELVLLLQELQQEKTQQQLLSPLPFPTTLPLLSASVACNKTVIADPVRHLQALAHDMLQAIIEQRSPPSLNFVNLSEVFVLRDLAVALSACIYQSLCDSDTCSIKMNADSGLGADTLSLCNYSSHLIATQNRRRRYSVDEPAHIITQPSKWPGVTNLRALLVREKDDDTPRLNILLCETFVATYMALAVYALATCDCHILYRLAGQNFSDSTWALLFGGGVKKLLRVAQTGSVLPIEKETREPRPTDPAGMWGAAVNSITKKRMQLNMKLLGQFVTQTGSSHMKEDKPTYREQFVPPEMSMISYFLSKPSLPDEAQDVDYDSAGSEHSDDEEEVEEDVFDGDTTKDTPDTDPKDNTEHSNPHSYSWAVMRYTVLRIMQNQLQDFLTVAGIELPELPVCSPLIHGVMRVVQQWQEMVKEDLESRGPPPPRYIPGCYVEPAPLGQASGPAIHKYRTILEKGNTPFHPRHWSAAPARRLWCFLVRQETVQDIFIKAVFGKRQRGSILESSADVADNPDATESSPPVMEPFRIIHKDQDQISAFCINQVNSGLLAMATTKEIQEMDISLLLEHPSWLEDECEFDIINLTNHVVCTLHQREGVRFERLAFLRREVCAPSSAKSKADSFPWTLYTVDFSREPEMIPATSFLIIQTPNDKPPQTSLNMQTNSSVSPQPGLAGQSGRGASMGQKEVSTGTKGASKTPPVMKHRIDGVRKMSSHPLLPLYLTGSQDGSVQMWEWGHNQSVCTPRQGGTFAKVTRVRFSQQGNKFGVADGDGNLSLFQVGMTSAGSRPFFTTQCHNKVTSDFVFLGSCSMVATAGHSSESKNVALWDTLLPQKKALITAFTCHEQGASSLVYAPQHQLLISAGKKGDVCIVDVRQRTLRHRFNAHESPIKCLAADPAEEFFATGAADGDIKVWGLTLHQLLYNFPGEHARSSFFKGIGQGVTQIYLDSSARLFSCGADGSMKVRQLPERDHGIHT